MKLGTPGFVPARLTEAREVRGLTAASLAEKTHVSRQSLSHYEKGRSTPSSKVLERIAEAVELPVGYFTRPMESYTRGTIFYRSMSSATKTARNRALRRLDWIKWIGRYVTEFVDIPKSDFPDLCLPNDPLQLSDRIIDDAAIGLRKHWGLRMDPISNVVLLLENKGAVVSRDKLGAQTLDSLSEVVREEDRTYVLIGTDKGTPARWRFDAAHELGHIMLHANVDPAFMAKSVNHSLIENQAHRFAASFLLPLESFGDELFGVSLDAFLALKPRWKTSIAMMIRRARDAGFLSPQAERGLWVNYARRGWRRGEPFDDVLEVEEPRLLRSSFDLLLSNGLQTSSDVVSALDLPNTDIEALGGLPPGFLSSFIRLNLKMLDSQLRTLDTDVALNQRPAPIVPLSRHRNKGSERRI